MNCPKCKYDLRRIDHRRCPECGCSPYAVFADRAERRHRCRKIFRAVSFWGLLAILVGGLWFTVYLEREGQRGRRRSSINQTTGHPTRTTHRAPPAASSGLRGSGGSGAAQSQSGP